MYNNPTFVRKLAALNSVIHVSRRANPVIWIYRYSRFPKTPKENPKSKKNKNK